MTMAKFDCVEGLKKAFKDIPEETLKDIVEELQKIKAVAKETGEYKMYAKQLLLEKQEDRLLYHKALLDQVAKTKNNLEFVTGEDFKDSPVEGMLALLRGTNRLSKGGNYSISAKAKSIEGKYGNMLYNNLKDAGLLDTVRNGAIDKQIANELFEIQTVGGKAGISGNTYARKSAEIINDVYKGMLLELKQAGVPIRELEGRVVRNSHDPDEIRAAGFEKWFQDILPKLDPEKTFKWNKDDAAGIHEFMKNAYDNITSDIVGMGPGSKGQRVLHFKSGEDWFEYNKIYGKQTLLETVLAEVRSSSNTIAINNTLGIRPDEAFAKLNKAVQRTIKDDPKLVQEYLDNRSKLEANFKEIMGQTKRRSKARMAEWGSVIRGTQNMASLGQGVLSTFTDWATAAVNLKSNTGKNLLQTMGEELNSFFSVMSKQDRELWARKLYIFTEDQKMGIFDRFSAEDARPGLMTKMQNWFFKLNGMKLQTDMANMATARQLAISLGETSSKAFKDLSPIERAAIERYGITDKDWDLIRTHGQENVEGLVALTPEKLAGVDAKILGGDANKIELVNKLTTYISDNMDVGIPKPGAGERAFALRGTTEDSPQGQLLRYMFQFKMFPLSMFRVFMRAGMSNPDRAAKTAMDILKGKGDNSALIGLMLSTTALGYIGMAAKDLMRGKTPRDPNDVNTWLEAMARGGSAGLYGDFLLGEYDKRYRTVLKDIAGPTLGQFDDIGQLWATARKGEPKAGKALDLLIKNAPGQNMIFVRTALDYLLLWDLQETLSPGFTSRMQKRARDANQEYWLKQ